MWKEFEHMQRNLTFLICLGISIITLWANLAPALPPQPKIPEDALTHSLTPTYQKQVNERIKWWRDMFVQARKSKEIIQARKGLMDDYKLYSSNRYKFYFAKSSVKAFKGLLSGKGYNAGDLLILRKKINIALALSEMAHKSIRPSLDLMISSKNEGLRYLGWKGYENISEQLVKSGPKTTSAFVKILDEAVQSEASPVILQKIFQVMEKSCLTKSASTSVIRSVKGKVLRAFETAWPRWQVKAQADGDTEMIETIDQAVVTIVVVVNSKLSDFKKNDRTRVLQMILNQAFIISITYDNALQAGKDKFAKIKNEKSRNRKVADNLKLQQACSQLLLSCEDGLGKVSGNKQTRIQQALKAQIDRGAAVRGSVLAWASALKSQGVKDPVVVEKKTSKPKTPTE